MPDADNPPVGTSADDLGPPGRQASHQGARSGPKATASTSSFLPRVRPSAVLPISSWLPQRTLLLLPFSLNLGFGAGAGWILKSDTLDRAILATATPPGLVFVALVGAALDPPCSDSAPVFLGDRPEDLIAWLTTRDWLDHDAPRPYNVGRYLGRAVVIEATSEATWHCPSGLSENPVPLLFRMGAPNGDTLGIRRDAPTLVAAIDVGGRTVAFIVTTNRVDMSVPSSDYEGLWTSTATMLQTVEFTVEFEERPLQGPCSGREPC